MSIHTVVVAALALIILIILIVLLTRNTGNVDTTINSCEDRGPEFRCASRCGNDETIFSTRGCGENQICCAQL